MDRPEMVIGNLTRKKDETDLFLHIQILRQNLESYPKLRSMEELDHHTPVAFSNFLTALRKPVIFRICLHFYHP
jgi:hypothetical protein